MGIEKTPPPPLGKNSQKIPYFFLGGVPKDDEDADNGDDNELEVGEDEEGSGEGGEADGVAGEVDVGK